MSNMNAQIEKETGSKMVITLRDHGLPTIEEFSDGVSMGEGVYTNEGVARALLQSIDFPAVKTPILPRNTIFYSESIGKRHVFVEVLPHRRTALYHEAKIKNVPFPRLVFGFELMVKNEHMSISDVKLAALEDSIIPNEESPVFFYPYTNVESSFSICWGGHTLPSIQRVSQLSNVSELFFNSPNSDCYYSSANVSGLKYRELVEQLKGKSFPDEYLKPTGYTLQQWMDKLVYPV